MEVFAKHGKEKLLITHDMLEKHQQLFLAHFIAIALKEPHSSKLLIKNLLSH